MNSSKTSNRCSWRRGRSNRSTPVTRKGDWRGTKSVFARDGVQLYSSLLDVKSDMLDPDIPKKLLQQSVASALGIKPTE